MNSYLRVRLNRHELLWNGKWFPFRGRLRPTHTPVFPWWMLWIVRVVETAPFNDAKARHFNVWIYTRRRAMCLEYSIRFKR